MEQIRVLRIIARLNVGGPAMQVAALSRGLDPRRFVSRVLVGAVGDGEADYFDVRDERIDTERITGLGRAPNPLADLRAQAAVIRAVRAFRPHIVETHTAKAGVLGRVAAKSQRVPALVHVFHGHLLQGYFSPLVRNQVVRTERMLARWTTKIVTIGDHVRDDLLAAGIGSADQYLAVAPGVRLPAAPDGAVARSRMGLPVDAPVIAFVARLTRVKRPDRFAEVALELARRHDGLRVLVAGDGDELAETRRRLEPLGDRAHFLGWRRDVEVVFAAADVALLTSDNEGMPVSLIEAALAGRPAVTTDVGSTAEVVVDGTTGFVTPPDVGSLAAAASRLLNDAGLRQQMGSAAARRAEERFSESRLAADIAELYESIAQSKGFGGERIATRT